MALQSDVIISIRPEQIRIVAGGSEAISPPDRNRLMGRVAETTFVGESTEHLLDVKGQGIRVISVPPMLDPRSPMTVEFDVRETVVLTS